MGGIDFILKPIIPDILLYKIEVLINLFNHNQVLIDHMQQLEKINFELESQLETIQKLNHQLENTNEQLEAFVYSATHDLRAPLRIIQSFGKILLDEYVSSIKPEGENYIQTIVDKAHSMSYLIDDLLNLSFAANSEMKREEVNVSQIVIEILDELSRLEPQRQMKTRIQPDLTVIADRNLLKIVLDNLLRNAWKFTSRCETAIIEFGMFRQKKQQIYLVRDNGAGFDMSQANKLFKPFQRLHSKKDFDGTGIGLTIVRRIIERHRGNLWFDSVVDSGATFYFTLPTL